MKKIITTIVFFICAILVNAQETSEKETTPNSSFVIMPIHNSVAGFSNVFLGSVSINPKLNVTFYSVFWNNPSFGNLNTGSDLFLETGVGLGFKLLDDKLYVNPTLGFGHGKFLSNGTKTLIGEGIIPNVLVLYNTEKFELDSYLSLYKSFRRGGDITRDLLLNWIVPGYKVSKTFSFGAYYEQLVQVRRTDDLFENSIYQWLGAYVKVSLKNHIWFRLAAGANLDTTLGTSNEFYKIQAFIPL